MYTKDSPLRSARVDVDEGGSEEGRSHVLRLARPSSGNRASFLCASSRPLPFLCTLPLSQHPRAANLSETPQPACVPCEPKRLIKPVTPASSSACPGLRSFTVSPRVGMTQLATRYEGHPNPRKRASRAPARAARVSLRASA